MKKMFFGQDSTKVFLAMGAHALVLYRVLQHRDLQIAGYVITTWGLKREHGIPRLSGSGLRPEDLRS